jgi:hypothetical protein
MRTDVNFQPAGTMKVHVASSPDGKQPKLSVRNPIESDSAFGPHSGAGSTQSNKRD